MKVGTIGALTGIAAAFGHVRRLTRDEALAEIRERLATVPAGERQLALDESAAMYVDPGELERWYDAALELLVAAGADVEAARAIRDKQPRHDLGGLGERH